MPVSQDDFFKAIGYNPPSQQQQATPNNPNRVTAEDFRKFLLNATPAEAGEYTRNAVISPAQKAGDLPTADQATTARQEGVTQATKVQANIAEEEYKRNLPNEKDEEAFANYNKGWPLLQQLDDSWETAKKNTNGFGGGGFQGWMGGLQRAIGGMFGQVSPTYDAWENITHMSRPQINQTLLGEGKAQSGEKSNIQGFEANLPESTDTTDQKNAKMNSIRLQMYNAMQAKVDALVQSDRPGAASDFMKSDTYKEMRDWHDSYVSNLQQVVQPTGPGNDHAPNAQVNAQVNAAIGGKQAQLSSTNPTGSPTLNQNPVVQAPGSGSMIGSVDSTPSPSQFVPNAFAKFLPQ